MSTNKPSTERPAPTRDKLLAALRECGPMTAAELAEYTGMHRGAVNGAINGWRESNPRRFFAIVDWRRPVGNGGRMAPVYRAGPGRDVPAPVIDKVAAARLYSQRYKARHKAIVSAKERARSGSALVGCPFAQLYSFVGVANSAAQHRRPKTTPHKED